MRAVCISDSPAAWAALPGPVVLPITKPNITTTTHNGSKVLSLRLLQLNPSARAVPTSEMENIAESAIVISAQKTVDIVSCVLSVASFDGHHRELVCKLLRRVREFLYMQGEIP